MLLAVASAILGFWITEDTVGDIAHLAASDSECSHIWIVPVVFVWLVWVNRRRLSGCPSGSRWPGALAATAGVILWMVGYRLQVQAAWHFGAVLLIAGGGLVCLGGDFFWRLLPAWGSVFFLVPMPRRVRFFVAQPLETAAAAVTQSVCEVLGMNVGRSGNQLSVNGVDVCVAEACNGVRLGFTLFLACYVAMFIRPYRAWVRVLILIAAPAVAVLANIFRLVPTLWVYGRATPATAERFHDIAGAVMVFVAFAGLTAVCSLLRWAGVPVMESSRDHHA